MSGSCSVSIDGRVVEVRDGETVLAACRRQAVPVPFSCGAGLCHTCLLQARQGRVPAPAQKGLPEHLQRQDCLLACLCCPSGPMELETVGDDRRRQAAVAGELASPTPDPDLWEALGGGATVRAVLETFYRRAYADPRLSPFFDGVTMERSIDKQYSFLQQMMTGRRIYFGDRPRNAHHWMVISDALFDHRQALMRQCLIEHGVDPGQIGRWERLEGHWRADIVKDRAWPRVVGGQSVPPDGYGVEVLGEASLCDHCGQPVEAGTQVRYHLRLGTVSCPQCSQEAGVAGP